ncbi:hypothetical protein NP233_g2423 [Leucocoprinus birnbaumii]|uniref:CENP-V/GFA domain-containing protein n=1 Tax=Leucocoprinus birnbaumii TaxID=56174 RepID=A0AAD5YXB1_9AGAR|nr:hypothetical protein NP233_g2423 [Leucocoprinus birnbaumii]
MKMQALPVAGSLEPVEVLSRGLIAMELNGEQLSAIVGFSIDAQREAIYSFSTTSAHLFISSVAFLYHARDACSVSGALIGGLAPSVLWLGSYYLLADIILFSQVHYYRWKRSRYLVSSLEDLPTPNTSTTALTSEAGHCDDDQQQFQYRNAYIHYGRTNHRHTSRFENTPLLHSGRKHLPGLSFFSTNNSVKLDDQENETLFQAIAKSIISLIVVSIGGVTVWWINEMYLGGGKIGGESVGAVVGLAAKFGELGGTWGGWEWLKQFLVQVFGWTTATIYIACNIPQILKNFETRCEGVSLHYFALNSFAECTLVLSILAKSSGKNYILLNAGWLAGQGVSSCLDFLHLLSDLIILAQVYYYRWQRSRYPIGPLDCLATPNTSTTALASETGYEVPDYEYDYNHTNYDSDIENTPLLSSGRKSLPDDDDVYNDYDQETLSSVAIKCFCSLVGISIIGIAAWWINEVYFDGDGVGGESMAASLESGSWGNLEPLREPVVQVLGWTTATLFRWTGSAFGITTKIPKAAYKQTQGQAAKHVSDNNGSKLFREFCGSCGSGILEYGEQAADKFRYITFGTLNQQEAFPSKGEFFCKYKEQWMPEIPDIFHKQQIKE